LPVNPKGWFALFFGGDTERAVYPVFIFFTAHFSPLFYPYIPMTTTRTGWEIRFFSGFPTAFFIIMTYPYQVEEYQRNKCEINKAL
ncbi:MAG: hypothetical protein WCH85_11900, partial [Methanomicrobiales archaeon]